jgi:predicted RNA-binding protein YlxR (DUF448 family)
MKKNINKHIPMRTCLVCRKVRPKRELIRLVRSTDGRVEFDISGKKNGRGAYLCSECQGIKLKDSQIKHSFRTTITPDNLEQLAVVDEKLMVEKKDRILSMSCNKGMNLGKE